MTFLSNMFIDTRPCQEGQDIALPMLEHVQVETAIALKLDDHGTRGEVYGFYSLLKE